VDRRKTSKKNQTPGPRGGLKSEPVALRRQGKESLIFRERTRKKKLINQLRGRRGSARNKHGHKKKPRGGKKESKKKMGRGGDAI